MANQGKGKTPPPSAPDPDRPDPPEDELAAPAAAVTTAESAPRPPTLPAGGIVGEMAAPSGLLTDILAQEPAVAELGRAAPTFGAVLRSIGEGVAASQKVMDESLVESAARLNETRIKVVTDVIQELGDDGLPNPARPPTLVTEEVSLVNYVPPTQQLWESVLLSMDMSVAAVDAESGITFKREQRTTTSPTGLWGFFGWFSRAAHEDQLSVSAQTQQSSMWASGQVRLDATLGARRAEKLPVGADFALGPQIYFSQGPVREVRPGKNDPPVVHRSLDVTLQVRKQSGAVNAGVNLDVTCDALLLSYADGYSSTTDAAGQTRVTLTRDYPLGLAPGAVKARLTVKLGDLARTLDLSL